MFRSIALVIGVGGMSVFAWAAPDGAPTAVFARQEPQKPQTEVNISLNNPGSHPKVGIQTFSVVGTNAALRDIAETLADVIAADLEFENEFYVISRKASAGVPPAATPQSLPVSQWTELGADYVLMGSVRDVSGKLDVEVRLINVRGSAAGRQDFGQVYGGCTAANPRFCAHSIADDMHDKLRNLKGVARTRIAFSSDRDQDPLEGRAAVEGLGKAIFLMDYDGAMPRRITPNKAINIAAAWGPDGRALAYSSYVSGMPDLYMTLLDGRPLTRPARGTKDIHNWNPAISPDGKRIAFTTNRTGAPGYYDIWVANIDGSDARNLTPGTDKWSEGAAAWSPSGAHIAFTSDRTGSNQIFVMAADGTQARRITFAEKCDRPTWSVLNFIAYTLERPTGKVIAFADPSGSDPVPRILTAGEQPAVSPNGRHVAFVTTRGGQRQIATVDYPTGKSIRLITTAGNNTYPNWSPTPGGR